MENLDDIPLSKLKRKISKLEKKRYKNYESDVFAEFFPLNKITFSINYLIMIDNIVENFNFYIIDNNVIKEIVLNDIVKKRTFEDFFSDKKVVGVELNLKYFFRILYDNENKIFKLDVYNNQKGLELAYKVACYIDHNFQLPTHIQLVKTPNYIKCKRYYFKHQKNQFNKMLQNKDKFNIINKSSIDLKEWI